MGENLNIDTKLKAAKIDLADAIAKYYHSIEVAKTAKKKLLEVSKETNDKLFKKWFFRNIIPPEITARTVLKICKIEVSIYLQAIDNREKRSAEYQAAFQTVEELFNLSRLAETITKEKSNEF